MKTFWITGLCVLASAVNASGFLNPTSTPEQILGLVLKHANRTRDDVNITLLKYDFLKREWHVELTPRNQTCIDCYPSYFIDDTKPETVKVVPHG